MPRRGRPRSHRRRHSRRRNASHSPPNSLSSRFVAGALAAAGTALLFQCARGLNEMRQREKEREREERERLRRRERNRQRQRQGEVGERYYY